MDTLDTLADRAVQQSEAVIRATIERWDAQVVRGVAQGDSLWVRWARPSVPPDVAAQCGPARVAEFVRASDFDRVADIRRRSGKLMFLAAGYDPDRRIVRIIQEAINRGETAGRIAMADLPHNGGDTLVIWWVRAGQVFGPELVTDPAAAEPETLLGRPVVRVDNDPRLGGGGDIKFGPPLIDTRDWTDDMKRTANLAAAREQARRSGKPNPHPPGSME